MNHSLFARDALPVLVEGGEPFENREDFYISSSSVVNPVAISPNGKWIVSGSEDNSIKIWDIKTGRILKLLEGHTDSVTSVVISSDGKLIVSGSYDNSIKVWDSETGKLVRTLSSHKNPVLMVAISQDKKMIVSSSEVDNIKIWNVDTGKLVKTLKENSELISIAISNRGEFIISGFRNGKIKVWDTKSYNLQMVLREEKRGMSSIAISKDGKKIFTASSLSTIITKWNRESKTNVQVLKVGKSHVNAMAICKNGKIIILALSNTTIQIWDTETNTLLKVLRGHTNNITSLSISESENTIVSSSNKAIKVWDMETGKELKSFNSHKYKYISSFSINKNDRYIISAQESFLNLWDIKKKKLVYYINNENERVNHIALSQDGKYIVASLGKNKIKIWDRETRKELNNFSLKNKGIDMLILAEYVVISKNSQYIAVPLNDGQVWLWDKKLNKETYFFGDDDKVGSQWSVAITEDNKYLISGSNKGIIQIWDVKSKKRLESFQIDSKLPISTIAISNDSKYLVTSIDNIGVVLWDFKKRKRIYTFKIKKEESLWSTAISSNNRYIISSFYENTSATLWDIQTKKEIFTFENVISVAFTQDSNFVILGTKYGKIKIWNIEKEEFIQEFIVGNDETWIIIDNEKNKLYRGDNGTLLYKKNRTKLMPIYPKEYNLFKADNLKLSIKNKNIEIPNGENIELNFSIENQGDRIYFLTINGEGSYLSVRGKKLSKIEKLETKTIALKIYAKLPKNNPKPTQTELNITVITGNDTEFNLSVPIIISHADINITKAELSEDEKNLNIKILNSGNEKLLKANVRLIEPFENNATQEVVNLEANQSVSISYVLPLDENGKPISLEDKLLSLDVIVPNSKLEKENPNVEVAPSSIWHIENVKIVLNKIAWYIYALWILAILVTLIILILFFNPMVRKLKNPKELMSLNPNELKEAKDKLSRIARFENILSENAITQERYEKAIKFEYLNQEDKANYLAKRIFAKPTKLDEQSYMMVLSDDFPLNVKQFILFMSNKESIADMMSEIKQIPQYSKNILFILSDNSELQAKIATEKGYEKFVRVQPQTMTKLLLAEDGAKVLADSFAEQLALTQISPYNLGGGESNSSMFFGRREIISHVVGRGNNNYIVIGSRQIGKSSLMKAIEREYVKNQERVHYISVGKGNFVRAMGRALGIKVTSLEELVAYISMQKEKVLFLLDEVDPFIKDEKESGYKVLDSFRKLSEEGSCNFILAGYWELYFYTMFDNQSPLKNFGEAIELGALEAEACREMITEPMQQLGLRFESDEAINEIVERTGQRPNLIAIICNNIIKSLGKEKRVVSMADVQEAIKGKKVYELFESWKKLDEDEEASKLDKIIVYSMVEQGSFRLAELVERLKALGLNVEMSRLETSLARLKVSYTIERDEEGVYGFMLPLFREYVLRDDYEVKLAGEVEGFRA